MSNYSTNDTPVGVGYNSDGEARAFVELSAVNVESISATTVSATTYVGIADGNLPTGNQGDIAYIATGPATYASISPTATPLNLATTAIVATQISDQLGSYVTQEELETELEAYATTAAGNFLNLVATNLTATNYTGPGGGGGGFTLPGGNIGDILYYDSDTSVTSVAPTGAPLNLATTSYVTSQGYLNYTAADSRYLTQVTAAATYLTIADAAATYLTIPDATATYLTTSVAESDYVNYDATTTLLGPYVNYDATTTLLGPYVNYDATTTLLGPYVNYDATTTLLGPYATESFVTTQGYITSITGFDIDALANVRINGTPQPEGYLFYNDSEQVWSSLITGDKAGFTVKAGTETIVGVQSSGTTTFTVSNVLLSPPNTTGKGDVNTGFVFLSGTNASSTEVVGDNFGKIWVTGPDQDISDGNHLVYFSSNDTTSGTAAIAITDNGLEALQTLQTPSYFQVISSGNITGVADEALTELGWASTGTYALSDPGGNLSLESGDSADRSVINVSGDGVYQIDATVRISNTTERGGIVFRIYRDTGSGFTDIPELRASNYASRGTGSGEGITNGSCSINTILSLNANDRLQFRAQPKTAGATSIIQQEGTYLRIIKIA